MPPTRAAAAALVRIRKLALSHPDATERLSHGSPAFFIGAKGSQFAAFVDNHHGDGRLAIWCVAPDGAQAALVDANPDAYFVPAYVGHLGWIGVRLDRKLPWPEVAAVLEQAYLTRAARTRRPRKR